VEGGGANEEDFQACLSQSVVKGKPGNWFPLHSVNSSSHTDW